MLSIEGYTLFEVKDNSTFMYVKDDDRGYLSIKKDENGIWSWRTWIEIPDSNYDSTEEFVTTEAQTDEFREYMCGVCCDLARSRNANEVLVENLKSLGFEAVGCHYEREIDDAIVYVNGDHIDITNWSAEAWELCRLAEGLGEV